MARAAKVAKSSGRPALFTDVLGEEICERIATIPRGLDWICDHDETLPSARTVHRWLAANESFCQAYLRARERQADLIFDQALEISDTTEEGIETVEKADGSVETRKGDMLGHRKLKVDTRLRMAGKLSPKKYGDKLELAGDMNLTVEVVKFGEG